MDPKQFFENSDQPAFPHVHSNSSDDVAPGLTKREYFAAMAMQGLLTVPSAQDYNYAENAVKYADALLEALSTKEV